MIASTISSWSLICCDTGTALFHGPDERDSCSYAAEKRPLGGPLKKVSCLRHIVVTVTVVFRDVLFSELECPSVARFKYAIMADDTVEVARAALWLSWS